MKLSANYHVVGVVGVVVVVYKRGVSMEKKNKIEIRGRDYPIFKDGIKMSLCMETEERRAFFTDGEIAKWRKEFPRGERQGPLF